MKNIKSVFLTCGVRSGAALLTRMLSVSDEFKASSATVNFFRFFYKKYDPLQNKKNLSRAISDAHIRLKYRFDIDIDKSEIYSFFRKNSKTYKNLYKILCYQIFKSQNFKYIGDKEGNAWRHIPEYLKMFPSGKVIIITRDPRDIICSFKKTTIAKKNDYLISLFNFVDLVNYYFKLSKKLKKNIYLVRFSDLKQHPKNTIKKVCKFLKIKFENKMLDESNFKDIKGNKWDDSKTFSFKGKLKNKTLNRWKLLISDEDLYLCQSIAEKQMRNMKYKIFKKKISDDKKKSAIKKLRESKLLNSVYLNWIKTGEGSPKYPLDPTKPKNWDRKFVKVKNKFNI